MLSFKRIILISFLFVFPLLADSGKVTKCPNIDLWFETFGEKEDPALLMIMGGCAQGILWPDELCKRLSREGFFVIRYDHRDMGLSSSFDYEKTPYDLSDMADDALSLLNYLTIKKAHLVGLSMGGPIAEIIAGEYPERVITLTLMMSSPDFRPLNLALSKEPAEQNLLPGPSEEYLAGMDAILAPNVSFDKLEERLSIWRLLNGKTAPFEEELQRSVQQAFLSRMINPNGPNNHVAAIAASEELIRLAPLKVRVPTVILHGTEDPIFPHLHGEMLSKEIIGSKFVLIHGMGHVPNRAFYDLYVDEIKKISETSRR